MAEHVCPWWIGYFLASPIRRLSQDPDKILSPYIKEGMKILDAGCAMGFFSIPLAGLVGEEGNVLCVDLQEKMTRSIEKRARKAGLIDRIETRNCSGTSLGISDISEAIDFALAFAVVHEVPDRTKFFSEIYNTLKPGAIFLIAEPKGHVSEKYFEQTISAAEETGFKVSDRPEIKRSLSVLFKKPGA